MPLQFHAVLIAIGGLVQALAETFAKCPGNLKLEGFGTTSIVPTGWEGPDEFVGLHVSSGANEVAPALGSRAYFAQSCKAGVYDHNEYLALNLLGKRMRYTTDMSDLGCGCNAAFYLTNMHQNSHPSECSDYYCDANNVCGQSCAEIDIQEGTKFSWHSTLHGKVDHGGAGKGIGGGGASWNGPREWSTSEYGPGASCIDTSKPFQVEVGFPADGDCQLMAMEITLSQEARSDCKLKLAIDSYSGMPEMAAALTAGMTPIVSYWKSADMLWMDGKGADGQGPCATDSPDDCGKWTKFSNFSVGAIPGSACVSILTDQQPAEPGLPKAKSTATTTTLNSKETAAGGFELPIQVAGPLGFFAGAFSVSLIFVVMGYIRSTQPQQMPERPEIRTLQHSLASSNSLVSQASLAQQREA
jgi:hypothetical protein